MKKITFFLLAITLTFCSVSYAQETVILEEDFEGGVIPATWIATQGAATEGWQVSTDGSGGNFNLLPGNGNYAWVNDSSCNCDMSDVRLSTPSLDLTNYSTVILSFSTFYAIWDAFADTPDNLSFEYSIDGGNTWILIGDMDPGLQWSWQDFIIDASSLNTQSDVRFSFHYDDAGFQAYGWAIDDFKLFEPTPVEASVESVLPVYAIADTPFKSVVTVSSSGSNTLNNVDVLFELLDATGTTVLESHTDNFTGLNINYLESKILESSTEWTVSTGNYKTRATITVTNDFNSGNNSMEVDTEVINVSYDNISVGEGYLALPGELQKINATATSTTTINTFPEPTFYAGIDFARDYLYGITIIYDPVTFLPIYKVHLISGDGTQYDLGELKFVGVTGAIDVNGIAYDETEDKIYVLGQVSGGSCFLAELNTNTLEATFIVNMGTENHFYVGIDFNDNGVLYGLNLSTARLDILDENTGAVTQLPNGLGYSLASIHLDLAFNDVNNTLYCTVNSSPNVIFGSVDTTSGIVTQEFQTGDQNQALIAYPSTTSLSVNENEVLAFEMYPNPTQDFLHIKSLSNFNYTIYGLDGKLLLEGEVNNSNSAIDVSSLSASTYFIRIEDNNTKSNQTKKFIKL